jgi:hypothetical protein
MDGGTDRFCLCILASTRLDGHLFVASSTQRSLLQLLTSLIQSTVHPLVFSTHPNPAQFIRKHKTEPTWMHGRTFCLDSRTRLKTRYSFSLLQHRTLAASLLPHNPIHPPSTPSHQIVHPLCILSSAHTHTPPCVMHFIHIVRTFNASLGVAPILRPSSTEMSTGQSLGLGAKQPSVSLSTPTHAAQNVHSRRP